MRELDHAPGTQGKTGCGQGTAEPSWHPAQDDTEHSQDTADAGWADRCLRIEWVFPRDCARTDQVEGSRVTLGRASDCEILIDSRGASRHHAEIRREGVIFVVRDLGSSNGTFLNGQRTAYAALSPGDVLRVGDRVGLISYASLTEPPAAFAEIAPDLWGGSQLATLLEPVRLASCSALPILLVGETGTGKERVARAIHHWSQRKGPFCAINCAALPSSLAEAELFGYRKGAFTGAEQASRGYFRTADTGTLLLDEIGDLSWSAQGKLLRVLEEGVVAPLGQAEPVPVDVRVIAAGRQSLTQMSKDGAFREDLHARLAGFTVELPPLRMRPEDIVPLFHGFLSAYASGSAPEVHCRVAERLCLYRWPGNVRELELLARRLLALSSSSKLVRCSQLPKEWGVTTPSKRESRSQDQTEAVSSSRRERDLGLLLGALKRTRGNVKAAAELVGFSRQRAYRLMAGKTSRELLLCQGEPNAGTPAPES